VEPSHQFSNRRQAQQPGGQARICLVLKKACVEDVWTPLRRINLCQRNGAGTVIDAPAMTPQMPDKLPDEAPFLFGNANVQIRSVCHE
jgi:hypothetical protein